MIEFCIGSIFVIFLFQIITAILDKRIPKKFFPFMVIIILVIIGYIGFQTNPHIEDDLYRYFMEINRFRELSYIEAMSQGVWRDTILSNTILFIVSRIGNPHLLSMVCAIALPVCSYFLISKQEEKTVNVRAVLFIELIVGGLCETYVCLSAVRQTIGIFIAIIIVYIDAKNMFPAKWIKWISYICLPFFHTSLIFVIIVAILTRLVRNRMIFIGLSVFLIFTYGFILEVLSSINIPIITSMVSKTEIYRGLYTMGTSFGISVSSIIFAIACFCLVNIKSYKMYSTKLYENEFYIVFIKNMIIIMIIIYPLSSVVFYRLLSMITVLCVPFFYQISQGKLKYKELLLMVLFLGCSVVRWLFQYVNYFTIWRFY